MKFPILGVYSFTTIIITRKGLVWLKFVGSLLLHRVKNVIGNNQFVVLDSFFEHLCRQSTDCFQPIHANKGLIVAVRRCSLRLPLIGVGKPGRLASEILSCVHICNLVK